MNRSFPHLAAALSPLPPRASAVLILGLASMFSPRVAAAQSAADPAIAAPTVPVAIPDGVTPRPPDPADPELLLWLDASATATLKIDAQGHVSAWANRAAPHDRSLVSDGSQRPTLEVDRLGGRPAVSFDGVDDVLRQVRFDQSLQNWTVAMVVAPRSNRGWFRGFLSGNRRGEHDFTTGLNLDMGPDPSQDFGVLNLEGAEDAPGLRNLRTDAAPFGAGQLIVLSTGADRSQLYVNGVAQSASPAGPGVCALDELRLGARFHAGQEQGYLDAEISEVVLYRKALSDQERTALVAYLVDKYSPDIRNYGGYTLDDAFRALPRFNWNSSRRPLAPIDEAIAAHHASAGELKNLETRLLAVLAGQATPAAKDFICRRLARIGTSRSVPPLARMLADAQSASAARCALEEIPGPESLAALRDALLQGAAETRVGLILSLGNRQDARAAKLLESMLTDADPQVALAAVRALGQIGAASSVAPLGELRSTAGPPLSTAAADALLAVGFRQLQQNDPDQAAHLFSSFADDLAPQRRAAALCGLVEAHPAAAAEHLFAALNDDDPELVSAAQNILSRSAPDEVLATLLDRAPQLPPAGRSALLTALVRRDHPAVRRAALAALEEAQEVEVRLAALTVLAAAATADDVAVLLPVAIGGHENAERQAAAAALVGIDDDSADAIMAQSLSTAVDDDTRVLLIRTLAARQADSAVDPVTALLADPAERVRVTAADALPALAGVDAADELIAMFVAAQSPAEQNAAARAVLAACRLAPQPENRAAPVLTAYKQADPAARARLLPLLGTLGGDEAAAVIREAMSGQDAAIRDAAVEALTNWQDASVVDELLDIARNSTSDAHRIAAVRGVARVAPRPGQLPPDRAFAVMNQAFELADRLEDRQLILTRLSAVRTLDALQFAAARIDDPQLKSAAILATADLAEGMKETHPQQARAALQQVLAGTSDEALRTRVNRLLTIMDR